MLEKIEKKLYKFSIPNLMRYIIFIMIIGFCINMIDPEIYTTYLALDFSKIMDGEIWRLFTFILYCNSGTDIWSIFLFSIGLMFNFFIGNGLEMIWGRFWFNAYFFSGIIFNILGSLIVFMCTGFNVSIGMEYVLESMFLAFAILFPDVKVNLYFVLPIKIKWMGYLYGVMLLLNAITYFSMGDSIGISMGVNVIASVLNFIIFGLLTRKRQSLQNRTLNNLFKKVSKLSEQTIKLTEELEKENNLNTKEKVPKMKPKYLHKCCICGKTDVDNSDLEFRYCSKCFGEHEYCMDHLFTHEHIKEEK